MAKADAIRHTQRRQRVEHPRREITRSSHHDDLRRITRCTFSMLRAAGSPGHASARMHKPAISAVTICTGHRADTAKVSPACAVTAPVEAGARHWQARRGRHARSRRSRVSCRRRRPHHPVERRAPQAEPASRAWLRGAAGAALSLRRRHGVHHPGTQTRATTAKTANRIIPAAVLQPSRMLPNP